MKLAILAPTFITLTDEEVAIIEKLKSNADENTQRRYFLRDCAAFRQDCDEQWGKWTRQADEESDLEALEKLKEFQHNVTRYYEERLIRARVELLGWIEKTTEEAHKLLLPMAKRWKDRGKEVLAKYRASQDKAQKEREEFAALLGLSIEPFVDVISGRLESVISLCAALQRTPTPNRREIEFIDFHHTIQAWLVRAEPDEPSKSSSSK